MRLLQLNKTGGFSLTDDLPEHQLPSYAILSHRWLPDTEEPTFEDLVHGTGREKLGYRKLQFCGEQARRDEIEHFWVDTCCIDKANKAELSIAINSMFRWYRNASVCYVHLSDVCLTSPDTSDGPKTHAVRPALRKSKWFTRGWTLQELLAPRFVEFFSMEGRRLGDRSTLEQDIHEVTVIPKSALRGKPLHEFSVQSRLSWMETRETKLDEDRAYAMLGIFDIYIASIYNEGSGQAFKRLLDEVQRRELCIRDLYLTNPDDDKKRIENTKGGLLEASYHWILENSDFQQWRTDQQCRLLWIKGDPGKGKTMLLCGVIDELEASIAERDRLSYFFCQASDARINNATAVLRGLIYLLLKQHPSLALHFQTEYDRSGKALFEDANAWVALSKMFVALLSSLESGTTYLLIDALDECVVDLDNLLAFIALTSSVSPHAKWIVSSRNWPSIEERLEKIRDKIALSLELNAQSVSAAVGTFIEHKVLKLAALKKYNEKTRAGVSEYLFRNADNTFLWVALVCQYLGKTPRWNTLAQLVRFPPGLDSLYERMLEQVCTSDHTNLCRQVLATVALVYRPVTMEELTSLVEDIEDLSDDPASVREIISLCGSFLTVREHTVHLVHLSAKDFLFAAGFDKVFPFGKEKIHYNIFCRSLQILSATLKRDIYNLRAPGYPTEDIEQPRPDPLATVSYSCLYWINHLSAWNFVPLEDVSSNVANGGAIIDNFLQTKYLYWLEALSLCRGLSEGVTSMAILEDLVRVSPVELY